MTPLGWIGVWLLVASVAAIVVEGIAAGVWSMKLARRARVLSAYLETERTAIQGDVETLRLAVEETRVLWRPYARALRWLRHPLVVALIASYRRRWAAR